MSISKSTGAVMVALVVAALPAAAWSQNGAASASAAQGRASMHRNGLSRQQTCEDRVARRAAYVAYIGARLKLSPEQKPLWDKVVAATQASQDGQRQTCAALPTAVEDRGKLTVVDRINHRQAMLQAQLQGMQRTTPAIEEFYRSLTPAQKAIVDHPFRQD